MNRFAIFSFASSSIALAGCGLFAQPMANPIITEHISNSGSMNALAATADRRIIVFYPNDKVCMEAPPDISENISASLNDSFSASATVTGSGSGDAKADLASQVASALSYAAKPSQGIMLYRSGMAWLCNEYANGVIPPSDSQQYYKAAGAMLDKAFALTALELVVTNGKIGPEGFVTTPKALQLGSTGGSENDQGTPPAGTPPGGANAPNAATPPANATQGNQANKGNKGGNAAQAAASPGVVKPTPTTNPLSDAQKQTIVNAVVDILKADAAGAASDAKGGVKQ